MVKQGKKKSFSLHLSATSAHETKPRIFNWSNFTFGKSSSPIKQTDHHCESYKAKQGRSPQESKEKLSFNYVSITALKRETHSKSMVPFSFPPSSCKVNRYYCTWKHASAAWSDDAVKCWQQSTHLGIDIWVKGAVLFEFFDLKSILQKGRGKRKKCDNEMGEIQQQSNGWLQGVKGQDTASCFSQSHGQQKPFQLGLL